MNTTTCIFKNCLLVISLLSATYTQPGLFSCCLGDDEPESDSLALTHHEPTAPPLLQASTPLAPEHPLAETITAHSCSTPTERCGYKKTLVVIPFCPIEDPVFQSCRFVHSIESLQEIAQECELADEKTVVLVDIDDTLIEDEEPTFQSRFIYADDPSLAQYGELHEQLMNKLRNNPSDNLCFSKLAARQKKCLVEPSSAQFIKNLQQKKVPVIALSAFTGGTCGDAIPDFHEFRYQQLLENGIDLDQTLPLNIPAFNSDIDAATDFTGKILLKRCIVSTHSTPKGLVAQYLIEHMDPQPEKVIFIDDNFNNHRSIAQALMALNLTAFAVSSSVEKNSPYIKLSSFLYKAARIIRPSDRIDPIIARTQFDLMDERKAYASYQEAAQIVAAQGRPAAILTQFSAHTEH